jgi:excisionase family DNA binding protein
VKEFLTGKEMCSLLRISRSTLLAKRIKEGLPHVRSGNLIRYPVRDIKKWIEERSHGGVAREHNTEEE